MGFSIISADTGTAISEDVLLDEIDGYDVGDLAELNNVIGLAMKSLYDEGDTSFSADTYAFVIYSSLLEIFNYINIITSGETEDVLLGFDDKVVPCGLVITVDGEECLIEHPAQLYDDTLSDFVTHLDLSHDKHAYMLDKISAEASRLLAYAVILCVDELSTEKLNSTAYDYFQEAAECSKDVLYTYTTGVPYTMEPED